MENKKTIEELEKQYADAYKNAEDIKNQIKKMKDEEKEQELKKLRKEQEARKKEVDAALEAYYKLYDAYVCDYGCYSYNRDVVDDGVRTKSKFFHWVW